MSLGLKIFTLVHVLISLAGIFSGFVVLFGLLTAKRFKQWTAFFLAATVLTSVTGFLFPVHQFMPSHAVGILSLMVLALAIYARYPRHLSGRWRVVYVISAMGAQYLNVFVAVVQAFEKIPALHAIAPTLGDPAFKVTQLVVLVLFAVITIAAVIRFRAEIVREISPLSPNRLIKPQSEKEAMK
jgi:hypothetical protein